MLFIKKKRKHIQIERNNYLVEKNKHNKKRNKITQSDRFHLDYIKA